MDWKEIAGIGVAGNFTGHLEQAGESNDFTNVKVKDQRAPKGVFPFYIPNGSDHYLHQMPISSDTIQLSNEQENHQIEPEMSLLCKVIYNNNLVQGLTPIYAMAHNDCSIRKNGAQKISEKKNWGANSKGVSEQRITIDRFQNGGVLDSYHLTCYLCRDNNFHLYGIDSPVTGYSYFYTELIDWLTEQMRTQIDEGPLENITEWLTKANHPEHLLVSIGATKYTQFGETNYLKPGDTSYVVLYDAKQYSEYEVLQMLKNSTYQNAPWISVLKQQVSL